MPQQRAGLKVPTGVSNTIFLPSRKQCVLNTVFLQADGHADYRQKAAMVSTFTCRHLHFPGLTDDFVRSWISPEIYRVGN